MIHRSGIRGNLFITSDLVTWPQYVVITVLILSHLGAVQSLVDPATKGFLSQKHGELVKSNLEDVELHLMYTSHHLVR